VLGDLTLTGVLFKHPPFILVSWTLTCEVSFYLLAGLLLALSRNPARAMPAIFVGAGLCALAAAMPATGWTLPLAFWPDFFAGACVSFILRASIGRNRAGVAAGAGVLLALSAAAAWAIGSYATEERRMAIAFAWALLALHRWDAWLAAKAPFRLLSWLGGISYSLYLTHVQIVTRVMDLGTRFVRPTTAGFALVWLGAVSASTLFGWIFWRTVEAPIERWRKQRGRSQQPPATVSPRSNPAISAL
jgi:peptidoglycan/LPS O-acetylase OafA/YrhL